MKAKNGSGLGDVLVDNPLHGQMVSARMLVSLETSFPILEGESFGSIFSNGKLVTFMNDGTSLKSVRQIRRTEYP